MVFPVEVVTLSPPPPAAAEEVRGFPPVGVEGAASWLVGLPPCGCDCGVFIVGVFIALVQNIPLGVVGVPDPVVDGVSPTVM